jgi:hypothetical protein
LLLGLFIICRLNLSKNQHEVGNVGNSAALGREVHNMVGHIKYRIYERDKKYNFRLPSCHLPSNSHSDEAMTQEIESIKSEDLHMYLHALSKVYYKKISVVAICYAYFQPVELLLAYKTYVKAATLTLFLMIMAIQLNTEVLNSITVKGHKLHHPVVWVVCLICFFIYLFFFVLEFIAFKAKCDDYFPLKYANISK